MKSLATNQSHLQGLQQQLQWQVFNDDVMGGQSQSHFSSVGETLAFGGFVNTDGGGFASIRTIPQTFINEPSIQSIVGIGIEVKGDGQRYQFGLQTDVGLNYWVDFTSQADWQKLTFNLADFVAKRRGRVVTDAPALNPSDLTGFNVMISHQQHGEFALQIRDISIFTAQTT